VPYHVIRRNPIHRRFIGAEAIHYLLKGDDTLTTEGPLFKTECIFYYEEWQVESEVLIASFEGEDTRYQLFHFTMRHYHSIL
jgi:hypothetical protein